MTETEAQEVESAAPAAADTSAEQIQSLQSQLDNALAAKKKLGGDLKDLRSKFEGIDPAAARAALQFQSEYESKDPDTRNQEWRKNVEAQAQNKIDAIKGQMVQAHRQELAARDQRLQAAEAFAAKVGRDGVVRSFIGKEGNADLAVRLARSDTALHYDEDHMAYSFVVRNEDGNIRHGADGNPLPLDAWMRTWAEDPVYKAAVNGHNVSGGGTPSGKVSAGVVQDDGPNPWDPKDPDYARQNAIAKSDPAKAKRLAAEHGKDPFNVPRVEDPYAIRL